MVYPPPTLVRKPTSRAVWIRRLVLVGTLLVLVGTWAVSNFMKSGEREPLVTAGQDRLAEDMAVDGGTETTLGPIDGQEAALPSPADPAPAPDAAPAEQAAVAAPPAPEPVATQPRSSDSRLANNWHYVPRLGDGPAAIFTRNGGAWDYALACNTARGQIEFIAVRTGDPQGFGGQYMRAGGVTARMDATYSRTAGGTISMVLPARHQLFDAVAGQGQAIEAQVVAGAPAMLPVNGDVVRLVRQCRGQGA
ncbi:hypothetical protein [Sphingomonas montanisoli]|uniref:Uncharacterized protein n=1 Tax=Sphingomonas montanisoli TaxID=2606412 RepID=A0A5D9CBF2_9SPHN|nr:hypothetical protein [Sphingomonas montanisoli]TZG29059.1 hypothetical protein FYJ91_02675 [Sphingomonas montanisoli]